ncbi:energy-coupling factor ABC transporter permease [Methanobacterium formicicum]|uniref:energy-coupling factor ABC transporter permease n=1 Tax=Methanobacterium formicicum TaxID=2162 RepID=UPI0024917DF3|nr:ECF transporter S component [Methanobacterium formicicum]
MHLSDGLLPLWQAAIYWILTVAVLALYMYKLSKVEEKEKVMVNTAILAAVTIVASSISIPSPFGIPIHLFIIPLVAILLGPLSGVTVAFLCFIVQFLFLGMGGITSLGANVVTMGIVMSFTTYYFYQFTRELDDRLSIFSGTFMGIIMATIAQVLILLAAGVATVEVLLATLIPFYLFVGVVEGVINIFIILSIFKLKPEMAKIEQI